MIRTRLALASVALIAFMAAPVLAQAPIERLAPENTIFLIGTKNLQSGLDHFKKTALWSLMQTDDVQRMWTEFTKEMPGKFDEMFQELGVDKESMVPPTGPVGFALFTTRDPELDTPQPAFIVSADYGSEENASKFNSIVMAALERGEKEGDIEFEEKNIDGRTVYVVDLAKMRAKQEEDLGDIDMNGMPLPVPTPGEMMQGLSKLHYVRDGNSLLLCSDLDALTEAMEQTRGAAAGAIRAGDRTEFQAIMNTVGEADMYGVLLTRDIMHLFGDDPGMGMMEMMKPSIRALVGEVQGYGMGVRFDSPTAMVEQTITAYMPNGKAGLTALMDVPVQKGSVPAFAGPDAISVSTISFRFNGLMDVIRKVVNSNPMLAMQAGAEVDEMAPIVEQITAAMGNKIHMVTSSSRPFTAANRHSMMAIELTKPQDLENMLAPMAAQAGIEARDFLGQRIYSLPEGAAEMILPFPGMEGQSFSLGIGGGYMLLGATANVEQGLRATSEPGGASITANADFQRATGAISNEGLIAWGYSDTVSALESTFAVQKESMEQMIRDMQKDAEEWGDEEGFKEMQAQAEAELRNAMKIWDMIDFDLLRRFIGPASWHIRSTENGLTMKSFQMSATGR